jgi:hypothetical protein
MILYERNQSRFKFLSNTNSTLSNEEIRDRRDVGRECLT